MQSVTGSSHHKAMKRIDKKNIHRILIRSTNWIGDAIMSTPAVRSVRKNFPHAFISILAKPWVAPVFEASPYIDEVIIYDGNGHHKGFPGKLRLAKKLRTFHFDAAILLQNAIEAAMIMFFAGIPVRIGFNTDGRTLLLTHSVRCTKEIKSRHQTQYYPEILTGTGLSTDGFGLDLFIDKKFQFQANDLLTKHRLNPDGRMIGINPGATYGTAKRWFPERFAELCNRIGNLDDFQFVIFGGPGDESLGEEIQRQITWPCISLCGQTSLQEAMALIQKCCLFITNDSGLMHVAAALDVPQIAIFGSTDPITTSPASPYSHMVRVPTPCSPCLKPDCPTDHRCMKAITVDMVADFADILLKIKHKN